MSEQNECPSCASKLNGMLMNHSMVDEKRLKVISQILNTNESQLCSKCVAPVVEKAKGKISAEKILREQDVRKGLSKLPVATIQFHRNGILKFWEL